MFEKASRLKLRFNTAKGSVSVEDLWDMPLVSRKDDASLDDVAKALNKAVKDSGEESFVVKKSATNTALELQFEIVKHIIGVKMAEAEAKSKAMENKVRREKLLQIRAAKEDAGLEALSIEDVDKMIAELA